MQCAHKVVRATGLRNCRIKWQFFWDCTRARPAATPTTGWGGIRNRTMGTVLAPTWQICTEKGCKCQIILFSLKDHSVPLRALPRHCFRGSSAQETMPAWSAYLEQAAWRKELSKRKLSAKNKWTFLCQVYKSAYIHHGCSGVESLGASRHGHQY